jgi:indolepyruvate decarboxylase
MVHVVPPVAHGYRGSVHDIDPQATAEAIRETCDRLAVAKKPVIIAGVEIHRFGLQDEMLRLAESAGIPIAATMLGKSVVSERNPMFVGLYEGALGDQVVTDFVEQSDLILLLGAFLSDINLGVYTANLDPARCVDVTSESVRVSHHHYHRVGLKEFLTGLNDAEPSTAKREIPSVLRRKAANADEAATPGDGPLRTSWMVQRLNRVLDDNTIVIADVGDSLFAATELTIHERGEFLSPAYYTSMGFSVPAALGAATAEPDHRVVVLAGDGAFQMTGQELSTLIRLGHHPIVIILDNHGYGTERYLHEGNWKYNEIHAWNYGELLKVYGQGVSHLVETEQEYEAALQTAWADTGQTHLIHAKLMENDASDTLKKLAAKLSKIVG